MPKMVISSLVEELSFFELSATFMIGCEMCSALPYKNIPTAALLRYFGNVLGTFPESLSIYISL